MASNISLPITNYALPGVDQKAVSAKIQATAQDFESMFLTEMLQQMFSGTESDELTGDPESQEVYQSMMVEQYGKIIARAGGIGVADYVTRTMLQTQEVKP